MIIGVKRMIDILIGILLPNSHITHYLMAIDESDFRINFGGIVTTDNDINEIRGFTIPVPL